MINQLPDEWFNLLHARWTKATSSPDYVKAEWMQLERILFQGANAVAELEKNRQPRSG